MEGQFTLTLMDAGGIPDEVWKRARREGRLADLLRGRRVKRRARAKNQVFDNFAAYTFAHIFSGPGVDSPYGDGGTAAAFFSLMQLDSRDTAPTYQEYVMAYWRAYDISYQCPAGEYKPFIEGDADTPDIEVDPAGRERVSFRSRFLFTPVEGVSAEIRGIATWCRADGDNMGTYMNTGGASRVRLYDEEGRKVTINKTILDVLLVEYEFTLTAI